VIIDTDLVYVNHPAGVVFHGWQAQALKTIEEIATYEDKFHTLIKEYSLSLDDAIEELHQARVQSQHKES
jgi:hypothetical protein